MDTFKPLVSMDSELPMHLPTVAGIKLNHQINAAQHLDRVASCKAAITADMASQQSWTQATVDLLRSLWQAHFSAQAVKWLAALRKIPVGSVTTKESLVNSLLAAYTPPVSIDGLRAMVADWKDQSVASDMDAGAANGRSPDGNAQDAEEDDAPGEAPDDEALECAATKAREAAAATALRTVSQDGDLSARIMALMPSLVPAIVSTYIQGQQSGHPAAVKKLEDDLRSPVDRLYDKVDALLAAGKFVSPMLLSNANLDRLRFKMAGAGRTRHKLGASGMMLVMDDAATVDDEPELEVAGVQQGYNRIIVRTLKIPAKQHLVPDMLSFQQKVWAFPHAALQDKAQFMQYFLYKHEGSADLTGDMDRDYELMARFLLVGNRNVQHQAGAKRKAPQAASGPARNPKQLKVVKVAGGPQRTCFSRSDPARGPCRYKRCRFKHACASCGQDHAAADCPAWVQAKADAVLAAEP
jgi:hypothetical protein